MNRDLYRYEFRFHGRVQGVGFRYTAYHAANSAGCTGWVKNEWDGTVLMELQGSQAQIACVLKHIENGTFIHIDRIEKKQIEIKTHETSFTVR